MAESWADRNGPWWAWAFWIVIFGCMLVLFTDCGGYQAAAKTREERRKLCAFAKAKSVYSWDVCDKMSLLIHASAIEHDRERIAANRPKYENGEAPTKYRIRCEEYALQHAIHSDEATLLQLANDLKYALKAKDFDDAFMKLVPKIED